MKINTVTIEEINKAMKANHKHHDAKAIRKAAEYMSEKHAGILRVSGEPYSQHPLRVALRIAEWGFESDVVTAALLHDVVEDTETTIDEIKEQFGKSVASMVDAVTKIQKVLDDHEEKLSKSERAKLSDIHMLHTMDDKSLFVKVADRIDNLSTIEVMPLEKQLAKAEHTRMIIIPALMQEGAYKLVDELENLCFQIEHRLEYDEIKKKTEEILITNSRTTTAILTIMENAFMGRPDSLPASLLNYKDYIVDFHYDKRSPISVFRQISRDASNLGKDFSALLDKKNIAIYDLTLIIDEEINDNIKDATASDVFFKFYDEIFMNKGLYITEIKKTTYKDSEYLLLCDSMLNLYRLFIKTQSEYMMYCLGDSMKEIEEFPWSYVDETVPSSGTFKNKIKVFKRNGDAMMIDYDATVLDFAFAIHTDLGLHFEYAEVSGSKVPIHHRLSYGDQVTVYTSPKCDPQLAWFRYAKTSKSIDKLVRYFEGCNKKKSNSIS